MNSKAALISVSDKSGLVEFAQGLKNLGYILLASKGSKKFLEDNNVAAESIEEYTGQLEILDGRVKTLHPKIYGGLLAKRDNSEHLKQLADNQILQIDIAVVNLYPFLQNLNSETAADPAKMVELVDVGGPCMIRAAAKNHASVYAVCDPADYEKVLNFMKDQHNPEEAKEFRRSLAVKVYAMTANYDLQISKYFSAALAGELASDIGENLLAGNNSGFVLSKQQSLRYGENPHQKAAYYHSTGKEKNTSWQQLGGKELSFNNFLDFDAAVRLILSLSQEQSAAAIIKHLNPCGVALAGSPLEAIKLAKLGDPRSHFGGIIALNCELDAAAASEIAADFAEIVAAPEFTPEALEVLRGKKNLRIIRYSKDFAAKYDVRTAAGGFLIQESDLAVSEIAKNSELVSKAVATPQQISDLQFAWQICSQVKSNAIVIAKDGILQAVGAGQMSRIDSVELAISKAKTHQHDLQGAVVASDAFFPFPDSILTLAAVGVKAIVAPKGSLKDAEAIKAANENGIALYFVNDRHFRH